MAKFGQSHRTDQSQVVAFLSCPEAFNAGPVTHIETHISHVFLAGTRAYKLKRAIKFSFVDYSTPARRRRMAEREVALNRRTAPELYLGVVPVTGIDGHLALGGRGRPIDWLVVMKRFDQDALLDRLAERDGLTPEAMDVLADRIATFHARARTRRTFGGADAMAETFANAARELERFTGDMFAKPDLSRLTAGVGQAIEHHCRLLDERRAAGFVRQCHGDLHLGNICLLDGRPTPFDAIEFSDAIACVDVLYDLAFLLMDLIAHDARGLANRVLNRYLEATEDFAGLALLPLFLSCRAAIRAMALALTGDPAKADRAKDYLRHALALLAAPAPRLIAVGGLSGSGKTTLARALALALAPGVGAVHVRSDVIRKRLFGARPETELPQSAYDPQVSARVFARMHHQARTALTAGQVVILDATHMAAALRRRVEDLAKTQGVPFAGLWLDAPVDALAARATARAGDASDADATIVHRQAQSELGRITWTRVSAGMDAQTTVRRAMDTLTAAWRT